VGSLGAPLFPRSVLLHHRAGVAAPRSIDVAGRTNRMIWAWMDTDLDDNDAPAGWVSYKYLAWPLSRSRLNPDNSCAYDRLTNGFLISPPIGAHILNCIKTRLASPTCLIPWQGGSLSGMRLFRQQT
jgi:hypothetical protein